MDKTKMKRIGISMPIEIIDMLHSIARQNLMTVSETIRKLIKDEKRRIDEK